VEAMPGCEIVCWEVLYTSSVYGDFARFGNEIWH